MSKIWRKSLVLIIGAVACIPSVYADSPCGSCNTCTKSCCPTVQKIKIKRNVGIGGGEPPRYYSTAVSRAAVLTDVPAVRFVVQSDNTPRTVYIREEEPDQDRSSSRKSCEGSSDSSNDTKILISKIDTLTTQTTELANVVDQLAKRVVAIEEEVVNVKKNIKLTPDQ